MLSIKNKLLLLLLFVSIIPLLLLGLGNYFQAKTVLTESNEKNLDSIIQSKNLNFENYIDNTKNLAKSISETNIVQEYLDTSNQERKSELKKDIENLIYTFQENNWGKYHHLFLVGSNKIITISPNHGAFVKGSPSSHLFDNTAENPWANKAFAKGEVTISDFSSWVESDHNHQMMFYPIKNKKLKVVGLIGIELQIPYEMDILTQNINLGETGKAYLTTSDGTPISFKINKNATSPLDPRGIAQVKETGQFTGHRINKDGKEVFEKYFANKAHPWILALEIESDEVLKDIKSMQYKFLIFLFITIVLVLILSLYFSTRLVKPLKLLASQMEEASKGKLDIKLNDINRTDEIGTLVKAFSRILKSLDILMKRNSNK